MIWRNWKERYRLHITQANVSVTSSANDLCNKIFHSLECSPSSSELADSSLSLSFSLEDEEYFLFFFFLLDFFRSFFSFRRSLTFFFFAFFFFAFLCLGKWISGPNLKSSTSFKLDCTPSYERKQIWVWCVWKLTWSVSWNVRGLIRKYATLTYIIIWV